MFAKLTIFVASFSAFVAAGPVLGGSIYDSCNTGPVQCCNQLFESGTTEANLLTGLVGATIGALTGQVGVSCSPVSVIGAAGLTCSNAQPVCCSDNHMNGLIVVGCNPLDIGF